MMQNRVMLTLRPMTSDDLGLVEAWLRDPEVARWYLAGSSLEAELDDIRQSIAGGDLTEMLVVADSNGAIGWCQWYLCGDYPEHEAGIGASPGDAGIDYAIGDPASRGRGVGTTLIAALVAHVRQQHPDAGIITDPACANVASRRVLEKNGFRLLAERPIPSEPTPDPMAIYRLPPPLAASGALGSWGSLGFRTAGQ